jgi:tetratricopeptide (TPR) repeat protein
VLRDLHELDGARTAFEHALRLDPRAAEAWCGLGLVRSQEGDPGAARACLERARELEPDHPETNAVLGQLAEDRGEREEAATFYRRALSVSPDNVEALFGLGAWLEERAPEEALRYVDRCVALRPPPRPHVRASLESARLHLARGETELARRLLAAVLDFNPAQPEALELRAALDASGR